MPGMNVKGNFACLRRWIGAAVLLASVGSLLWGVWPPPISVHRLELSGDELGMPVGRQARLEWPAWLRQGDGGEVNLVLETPGQTSAAPTVLLIARLEFPALEMDPPGEQREGLNPDLPARFTWEVIGRAPGNYAGTAWLYRIVSSGENSVEQRPLMAPRFSIEVYSLAGLGGPLARWLGLAGLVSGAGLLLWPFRRKPAD